MTGVASLLTATARSRALRGRARVVKLGGSAMEEPAATTATLESVVALQTLGVQLLLVHGGGKPIDRAMESAGLVPKKVAGRRYTDEPTLEIVVRVLGELNLDIARQINDLGGRANGFRDGATFPLAGERLTLTNADGSTIDLGHVGRPTVVNEGLLLECVENAVTPVIPSLCRSAEGGWLNVNADTVASAVAGAFDTEAVIFLTDTPGILRDKNDANSRIDSLSVAECRHLIEAGVIDGGMIPKVEACFEALAAGAERAVILDGRVPHGLLADFAGEPIAGTEIVP
jgi:acetylglutamate kinase